MNTTKSLLRAHVADQIADYRFSLRRLAEGEMSNADMKAEEDYAKKCIGNVRRIFQSRHTARIGRFGDVVMSFPQKDSPMLFAESTGAIRGALVK